MMKLKCAGKPLRIFYLAIGLLVFTLGLGRSGAFFGSQHLRPLLTGRDSGTSRECCPRPDLSGNTSKLLALAESDVHNARQFVLAQLRRLRALVAGQKGQGSVAAAIQDAKHHFGVTQYDLWRLRNESGLLAWQAKEVEQLSGLIQHRIHVLQNPADCQSSKKIICRLPVQLKNRGIGSQLHHLSYCFLAAYNMQRTLIIDNREAAGTGFVIDPYILPLSETCVHANGTAAKWPGRADSPAVQFPNVDGFFPRPSYFPRSIPKDIARRLMSAHGDPFAWWMGQFFKYALRMTSGFQEHVERLGARLGYEGPIVGVQVRRTDKLLREARFIKLEEYMEAVDDFFDDLEIRGTNVTSRRIYLATDDPRVLQEARTKYPNYKIVCNEESVATANMRDRRSEANLKNFLADVYFLSRSDFLVCSMSSNICRLAYELLQTLRPDAPRRTSSVDSAYWFHFEAGNKVQARYPHTPRSSANELALQKGDQVKVIPQYYRKRPNLQDGFRFGRNLRTASFGLYPVYKTVEVLRLVDMPSFDRIDKMEKGMNFV